MQAIYPNKNTVLECNGVDCYCGSNFTLAGSCPKTEEFCRVIPLCVRLWKAVNDTYAEITRDQDGFYNAAAGASLGFRAVHYYANHLGLNGEEMEKAVDDVNGLDYRARYDESWNYRIRYRASSILTRIASHLRP